MSHLLDSLPSHTLLPESTDTTAVGGQELPLPPEQTIVRVFARHSQAIDNKTGKPVCKYNNTKKSPDDRRPRDQRDCRCPKWVYIRHNGRNKEISAHTRSWTEAERYARQLDRFYDPVEQARQMVCQENQPKVKDMEEAINAFLTLWTEEEKAEGTVGKLRTTLVHRLLPFARKQHPPIIYLHQLQSEHIDQWKMQLCHLALGKQHLKLGGGSKKSEHQRVVTFLNYCVDKRWIKENVAVSRRRIRKRLKRVEERDEQGYIRDEEGDDTLPLTPEQFDALVEATDSFEFGTPARLAAEPAVAERVKAMLYYTRYSGLRIGDAATSRKDRLRTDDSLFLYAIKNQNRVEILLPHYAAEMLRHVPPGRNTHPDYIFWSKRSKVKSEVSNWVKKMAALRDIAIGKHPELFQGTDGKPIHVHWHCLRDTLAVELLEHEFLLEQVASLLGDSVQVVTKHYAKWSRGRQSALTQKLRNLYSEEENSPAHPPTQSNVVSITAGQKVARAGA